MTPLLIGLASVVVVILIAAAVGMRHVRNEERADLADLPGGRNAVSGRHDPDRASDRPLVTTARSAQPGQDPLPAGPVRDLGAARQPAQPAPRAAEPRHDTDR